MMKTVLILCFLCLAKTSLQSRSQVKNSAEERSNYSRQLINASNAFAFKLLRDLPSSENIFVSPLSVSMSMGMLYLGAKGETAIDMHKFLGYDDVALQFNDVHIGYRHIMNALRSKETEGNHQKPYTLETANAMLVEKRFDILPDFRENGQNYYDAAVESVSFALHPEYAVESVNGWVAWITKQKISKILQEPLDPLTTLFLLNTVYFKGSWKTRFDQRLTMPDTFYNNGQVPKTVPMMRQKAKFLYSFDNRIKSYALDLPYIGNDIKMLLLLPEKRDGLQEMEAILTRPILKEIVSGLREVTVQVTLPRFYLNEEYDMISVLKSMGLNSIFDASRANLTGISEREGLYVTKVIHKCVIEVNEEGSEAAAITGVAAGVRTGGPLVPLFTADHPFLFFIRDSRTNAILFVGRANNL